MSHYNDSGYTLVMTLLGQNEIKQFESFVKGALNSQDVQVYQLAGDASARKYFRVVNKNQTYVLMQWEPFKDNDDYPFLSVLNHFQKFKVRVPDVIAKSPDKGLVLLEDLGDLTLERKFWENQNQDTAIPFYKQAIDEIIKIHYPATKSKSHCTAFKIQFDQEKFTWELNYAQKYLIEGVCDVKPEAHEKSDLQKTFAEISKTLDQEQKYISHRDYHSRNLMIKLGEMRVIDFQDARLGPVQYDLVSLLKDSYVNLSFQMAQNLIEYYLEQRAQYEEPIKNRSHFDYIYEVQSVQRCFKACGSFASFLVMRNDTRYLKYISHTLLRVKESINKLGEFTDLLKILEKYNILYKDYLSL